MRKRSRPEIVSASIEAFNAQGAQAVLPYLAEDVVWHSAAGWAGKPVYHGHTGVPGNRRAPQPASSRGR